MKKLLMLMFCMMFISFASAINWTDDDLVSYYKLDNSTGDVFDMKGNNHGTNKGADRGVVGKIENSFDFEIDENDYANLTYDSSLDPLYMSVSAWVNVESASSDRTILGRWQNSGSAEDKYILRVSSSGYAQAIFKYTNGTQIIHTDNQDITSGWHHLVWTTNSTSSYLYVDGVERVEGVGGGDLVSSPNYPTILGALLDNGAAGFDGLIDEVGIWNRSLFPSEVTELYNGGEGLVYGGPQQINLNTPIDNSVFLKNQNISFNCNLTGGGNILNLTLIINEIYNLTVYNTTASQTNLSLSTTLSFPTTGAYNWSCIGYDGEPISSDTRYFNISNFVENNQTFNVNTIEGQNEEFILNISHAYSLTSATLIYNGSSYLGSSSITGGYEIISRSIDIPSVTEGSGSEEKQFYWRLVFLNDSQTLIINSSINNQTVNELIMQECGSGETSLNFTIWDEELLTNLTADIDIDFEYFIGDGSVSKKFQISKTDDSFTICIQNNATYITNFEAILEAEGYTKRVYKFRNFEADNNTKDIKLFLLNESSASNIIIEVRDEGLQPYSNVYVNISRFYPDLGYFQPIVSQATDNFGQFVEKMVQNDVKYKFEFYDQSGTLLKTSDDIRVICRATICVLPFVIESISDEFDDFEDINDFTYALSFDNSTNKFTLSWDDQTTDPITIRLEVTKYLLNGSSVICNTSSTSSTSSLTCTITGDGTYKAQAYRNANNEGEVRIAILSYKVGDPSQTYGLEGLFWAFILLFTCIGIGAFNPTIGVSLYGVGFIGLGIIGIISMPMEVFFANTILCILFIWAVKT